MLAHLLRELDALDKPAYEDGVFRLEGRALRLAQEAWESPDAGRLAARIHKHAGELFTFHWHDRVDPTNNHSEREVRPAVRMRKNSYQNASPSGAQAQAVADYAETGRMPAIPGNVTSGG